MGQAYELSATLREKVGKGAARAARRQGLIPAVIYGDKQPPIAINLPDREVYFKIRDGGFLTTLATIAIDGEKIRTIPRDFQVDPISDRPIHVDFLRISKGATITVEIPVHFVNDADAPGIKRGGVLNIVRHRVEVVCPAEAIPDHISADLTGMDINDSLHISSVTLPEGVKPTIERDFTIATIAAPAGIKEEIRAAAAAAAQAGPVEEEAGQAQEPEAAET